MEIDCSSISQNVQVLRKLIGPSSKVLAVLKSDGYGMGSVQAAEAALSGGAEFLGLGNVGEALRLEDGDRYVGTSVGVPERDVPEGSRSLKGTSPQGGLKAPILLMHPPFDEEISTIVRKGYVQAITDFRTAELLSREAAAQNKTVQVHLNVNTGMNRLGLGPEEILEKVEFLFNQPGLHFSGVFAHFSSADKPSKDASLEEYGRFENLLKDLEKKGIRFKCRHMSNSAAILDLPHLSLDMVRPGILLYGIEPSVTVRKEPLLRPAICVKTRVVHQRHIEKGETVSYHKTWKAPESGNLATLPAGYADGIPKAISCMGEVLIRGERFPLAGLVCMDLTVVYLGKREVSIGEEVVFIGKQGEERIGVLDWAKWGNLDPHEILTGLGKKLPKTYFHLNERPQKAHEGSCMRSLQ